MPRFQTQELIQELEATVRQMRQTVKAEFADRSPAHLLRQPAPAQWSVAQCLDHLNGYGRYYLPLLQTALDRAEAQEYRAAPTFRSGWLGQFFTRSMQPNPDGTIGMKSQAHKNHVPAPDLNALAVVAEFLDQQRQLLALLERAGRVDIGRVRVPISIARWITLSVGDALRFLIAHQQRHLLQARRALGTVTPAAAPPAESR